MRKLSLAILGTLAAGWILVAPQAAQAAPDARLRPALDRAGVPTMIQQGDRGELGPAEKVVQQKSQGIRSHWSNGKPGLMQLMNTTMLIKSGAMSKANAHSDVQNPMHPNRNRNRSRRWLSNGKPGKLKLLNTTMLLNSGAMQRPDTISTHREEYAGSASSRPARKWLSNGKKGQLGQFNLTMLIKAGALSKPDVIKTHREPVHQHRASRSRSHRVRTVRVHVVSQPPRNLNHGMVFRRERVGRFCHGRSCE